VSIAEQSADLQTDELTAAGCLKVFVEQVSGVVARRPQLDWALSELQARDTLVDVRASACAPRLRLCQLLLVLQPQLG